ncbi:MAG: DNA polymerase III subunit beta, partial [bacterium]|nr:DNA polymerase III subunit beta [bacterium]
IIIEADIRNTGSIVLNSRMFGDIVRRLPESEVLIEVKENNLVFIDCENSHFELRGLPSMGFPAIPSIKKENALKINQKLIRDMIKQTIFAVSYDENRPILTGSLIEYKNDILSIVSIDGYRLALRKNDILNNKFEFSVVIPGKTLNEIVKILQPVEKDIIIYNSDNQIMFDIGNCRVVSRLLEGEYLNYKGIIPNEYETKIRINTKDLLASMERVSLLTVEEKKYPVKLSISDDKIVITSNTEIGAVREEIRVEMEGNNLDIGFNPRYFTEALKVIEDEVISLSFTSNVGPCILTPCENEKFCYLILPLRTRND